MYAEAKAKVALPVETVWNRLTDLRALSQWAPDVASSPSEPLRPGATRWARLYEPVYGKDVLIERITDVDAPRHNFTYDIEGGIGPLTTIQTTWRVEPDGAGGSIVTCSSLLTLSGPARFLSFLVLRRWTGQLQALVDGFARWAKDLQGDVEFMDGPAPSFQEPEPEQAVVELREREPEDAVKAKAKPSRSRPKPATKARAR